jgi:hypothetical protein
MFNLAYCKGLCNIVVMFIWSMLVKSGICTAALEQLRFLVIPELEGFDKINNKPLKLPYY